MKNYKKMKIVSNLFALLTIAICTANATAQRKKVTAVDISCRPALYFGNSVLDKQPINAKSRYVNAGDKIVLTPADSFDNQNGVYSFNMMYVVYGSPMKEAAALGDFVDRLKIGGELLNQHTVNFANSDSAVKDTKIKYLRTHVNLPIGTHKITLLLDDDKKVSESNENNNTFTFTVEVSAKP